MIIDHATTGDRESLHLLIESAYRGDSARRGWTHEADLLDGQRTDLRAIDDMFADPLQTLLVARDDMGPAGCIAITDRGDGLAYIGLVTVDPDRQGSGLGRRLLESAEAFAASTLGARRLEMTVIAQREELVRWYERRGYRRTGERRPFPATDPRFGLPRRDDLEFMVLEKSLGDHSLER
jgi:ribosomal protein S18 acetylase RimI-like enzyme